MQAAGGAVGSDDDEDDGQEVQAGATGLVAARHTRACRPLPWMGKPLGHALLPPPGATSGAEEPAGVLQLIEGGQVVLHSMDAKSGKQPLVWSPDFQAQQTVTCTFACYVRGTHGGTSGSGATLSALRAVGQGVAVASGPGPMSAALSAGTAAKVSRTAGGTVYCTGALALIHCAGTVCMTKL